MKRGKIQHSYCILRRKKAKYGAKEGILPPLLGVKMLLFASKHALKGGAFDRKRA